MITLAHAQIGSVSSRQPVFSSTDSWMKWMENMLEQQETGPRSDFYLTMGATVSPLECKWWFFSTCTASRCSISGTYVSSLWLLPTQLSTLKRLKNTTAAVLCSRLATELLMDHLSQSYGMLFSALSALTRWHINSKFSAMKLALAYGVPTGSLVAQLCILSSSKFQFSVF